MKKRIEVIMAVALLIGAYFFAREGAHMVENMRAQKGEICIVVDAGHGGDDPGKIGINKEKEKDINLKIARKLQKLLEKENIKIVPMPFLLLITCHYANNFEGGLFLRVYIMRS